VAVVDPVDAGLVASLTHPAGNATGITQSIAESLLPKRIQLLREMLPGVTRIGLLGNPLDPGSLADQAALAPVIGVLGLSLIVANGTNPVKFAASVASLVAQRVQAIVTANGIAVSRRVKMIELTQRARNPGVGFNRPIADAGALFSHGPSIADQIRRTAPVVDKLLRGAKPADIPVEAANRIELVVNLKNARALGIVVPQSSLPRADEVIE
jgi:putative ABC transport system substrate-binding protein